MLKILRFSLKLCSLEFDSFRVFILVPLLQSACRSSFPEFLQLLFDVLVSLSRKRGPVPEQFYNSHDDLKQIIVLDRAVLLAGNLAEMQKKFQDLFFTGKFHSFMNACLTIIWSLPSVWVATANTDWCQKWSDLLTNALVLFHLPSSWLWTSLLRTLSWEWWIFFVVDGQSNSIHLRILYLPLNLKKKT